MSGDERTFHARWRDLKVTYVIDARALTIREPARQTELPWSAVRGVALVTTPRRYAAPVTWLWVACADRPGPEPRIVPLRVDLDDPPTRALIDALKQTPHWRGEGSALAMTTALGVSNRRAYLVVAAIIVVLVCMGLGVGLLLSVLTRR